MSEVPITAGSPTVPAGGSAQWAPLGGLSRAIVASAAVLFVVALVHVVMDWTASSRARGTAAAGISSTEFYRNRLDDLSSTVGVVLVAFGLAVVGAVLFLMWMSRARANSELLSSAPHRLSRGMAIGGWFIPVANLWLGRVAIEDVWRASAPSADERRSGLITAWWLTLLGGFGLSVVLGIANPTPTVTLSSGSVADGLDAVASAARFVAVSNTIMLVVGGVSAALFCAIILRISAWQEAGTLRPVAVERTVAGTVPGAPAHGPGAAIVPVGGLGSTAVVLAWIWTALYGCAAVGGAMSVAARARRDSDGAVIGGVVVLLAVLVGFIVLIPAGVVLARWCRRAQANTSLLAGTAPGISPEWAVAGWFVPIANLVVPVRVVLGLARPGGVGAGLVGAWWAAWLGAWAGFWLSFPWPGQRPGTNTFPMWLPAVLFAVAAVLLTVIISAVGRHQQQYAPVGIVRIVP